MGTNWPLIRIPNKDNEVSMKLHGQVYNESYYPFKRCQRLGTCFISKKKVLKSFVSFAYIMRGRQLLQRYITNNKFCATAGRDIDTFFNY